MSDRFKYNLSKCVKYSMLVLTGAGASIGIKSGEYILAAAVVVLCLCICFTLNHWVSASRSRVLAKYWPPNIDWDAMKDFSEKGDDNE